MRFIFYFFIVLFCLAGSKLTSQTFYNTSAIQKIEVQFAQANWDYMLDTAKMGKENYIMAQWVKINGVLLDSVGVKYKGNSSFDSTYKKIRCILNWILTKIIPTKAIRI
ncbi:MAG: hypothetical protein IPJ32_07725 [Sphingobacteriaceae bacterium]|nr:hypothetical protein [Sphingobacteriaceae bacterium]